MESIKSWIVIGVLFFVIIVIGGLVFYYEFIYKPDQVLKRAAQDIKTPSGFPASTKATGIPSN